MNIMLNDPDAKSMFSNKVMLDLIKKEAIHLNELFDKVAYTKKSDKAKVNSCRKNAKLLIKNCNNDDIINGLPAFIIMQVDFSSRTVLDILLHEKAAVLFKHNPLISLVQGHYISISEALEIASKRINAETFVGFSVLTVGERVEQLKQVVESGKQKKSEGKTRSVSSSVLFQAPADNAANAKDEKSTEADASKSLKKD